MSVIRQQRSPSLKATVGTDEDHYADIVSKFGRALPDIMVPLAHCALQQDVGHRNAGAYHRFRLQLVEGLGAHSMRMEATFETDDRSFTA
ncbi:hypothetical protein [Roseovarius arcticus]|uniref:hypothetical protein n=1 Tax=Roseovarius arcticus TaxID=2547404 RepID=UPI00111062B5|nr:hypothetical protein [Roseovarius arcticus]